MPAAISRPGGETPTRSTSSATPGSKAASIHRAHVINVNMRDYTVDVQTEAHPFSNHFDIPFMVPYVHQAQGEGFAFMPEIGSSCWVCSPSETGRDSFVLGWTTVQENGTFRGGRELLNPGDIHLNTRDGNFVTLRRGGIVQIGATPVCQRLFLPIRNIIQDFAENYQLSTPAGDLTWLVDRTDASGDGHQGCLFTLAAKEFSDDPNANPLATLKIGSHGDGNDTILTLQTLSAGGGSVMTNLTLNKSGDLSWSLARNGALVIKGDYSTKVSGKMTTTSGGDMSFASKGVFSAKGNEAHVASSGATLDLTSTASLNGAIVKLGDAIAPVMIDTGSFSLWAAAVTALLTGPPTAIAFKGILPPLLVKSSKVKA